ncbi:MAG TPA: AraC family transcriptional regulator [Rhizobacter sp.]|nr:AraC family transcriptional regulator [Rhizobacter sp.]
MTARVDTSAEPPQRPQVFLYESGFMFCCPGMVTGPTERFSGMLLLATSEQEFELEIGGRTQRQGAVVVKPFVTRSLNAHQVPFVSLGVGPSHPAYRVFALLREPGHVSLPRALFFDQLDALDKLLAGRLNLEQSRHLFEECVGVVAALLPAPKTLDARIASVMQWLREDPDQSLETLADKACLSYYRLSHLFSQEMGVSLRHYQSSYKVIAACRFLCQGMSLTDTAHAAGFSDSAHLSRMWVKAFGVPPSLFVNGNAFAIHAPPALASRHKVESSDFADSLS